MGELGELAHPWITVSIEIAILKIVIDLPFSLKYQKIAALEMRKNELRFDNTPGEQQGRVKLKILEVWEWLKCSDSKLIETLSKTNFRNSRETTSNSTGSVANQPEIRSVETLQKHVFRSFETVQKQVFRSFETAQKQVFQSFETAQKHVFLQKNLARFWEVPESSWKVPESS